MFDDFSMKLKDKVIVITGASSGIGKSSAHQFAKEGSLVALGARRLERLQTIKNDLENDNPQLKERILIHPLDVTVPDQIRIFFSEIAKNFGQIDVLVNNAGVGCVGRIASVDLNFVRQVMETNFFGALQCIQEALRIMKPKGHIINISSVVGKRAVPEIGAYCASKFALNALSDALRVELKGSGVHVTTICPGLTETEFAEKQIRPNRVNPYKTKWKGQSSKQVAKAIVKAVKKRPREIHLSLGGNFLVHMERISPRFIDRILQYRGMVTEN